MTRIHGQILRTVGLFIEMLGIVALVLRTKTDDAGAALPGSFTRAQTWVVIGTGFVVWLVGSSICYWPRSARKQGRTSQAGEEKGKLKL